MNDNGIPAERVVLSGGSKYSKSPEYHGDVNISLGNKLIRVEVKSRQKLPAYVVGMRHNKPWNVKEIEHLCYILTEDEFLDLCRENILPENRLKINSARCGGLVKWFKQDDSDIVAMKEFGKRQFYFAVKFKTANKIGGKYKV